jgi:hypothetical protein
MAEIATKNNISKSLEATSNEAAGFDASLCGGVLI